MKAAQLRELSEKELTGKIGEQRRELLSLRIQRANQQLKNPLKLRKVRRSIARMLTIVKEKKVNEQR